ncbi:MAG: glycoside-pentoside-hexuronide (GPH):cation symporter [Spirochaetota bacterium]|jgi:melibiose permease/lactose/raffinose/galactose permease|nr:glycoside-pentoside-hexuronide (GPH):cation symporter [Spirochaetota bacterium]
MKTSTQQSGTSGRNRFAFGFGTIGRDMVYALISMYLIYYLTDVINLPASTLWWVAAIILIARIYDALNDPVMGFIVDNTRTRWGKFKPWIAIGSVLSALFTVLLFADFGLSGEAFIGVFAFLYLMWGMSYTANDISYWSMLPALSTNQKEREKIGAFARICANIGLFFVVAGIVPITAALGNVPPPDMANIAPVAEGLTASTGSLQSGYFIFAVIVALIMVAGQCVTLFGVRETQAPSRQSTPLRELLSVIIKNDQLLFTAIAMSLFMIGYTTTTAFGLYFFKYAYGNEGMYPIFALILGVSQLAALAVFPLFSKRFERAKLFTAAIVLIVAGYLIFFFAPTDTMLFIGTAGILIFIGQSFVQLLMLMFLADSVDYGHWKLGRRNDSITFSLQPFINKMGGAIASGVVSAVVIIAGITEAQSAADVTPEGLLLLKVAMLVFPMLCIIASYAIYRKKYIIDSKFYSKIQAELRERGEIKDEAQS